MRRRKKGDRRGAEGWKGKMTIEKRGRFWAVLDAGGVLVCLTVYRKGAREVVRRLSGAPVAYTKGSL